MSAPVGSSEDKPASKTITVRPGMLIDGGKFVCDNPAHPHFETSDPVEWDKHRTSATDTQSGETACAFCGNKTQYSHIHARNDEAVGVVRPSVMCDKCKAQIVKEEMAIKDANPPK